MKKLVLIFLSCAFSFAFFSQNEIDSSDYLVITGIVKERDKDKLLEGVEVIFEDAIKVDTSYYVTNNEGEFSRKMVNFNNKVNSLVHLKITLKKEGYYPKEIEFKYSVSLDVDTIVLNNFLKLDLISSSGPKIGPYIVVDNILFDKNSSKLSDIVKKELSHFVFDLKHYNIKDSVFIEFEGHASHDESNKKSLSSKRAQTVKNFLVSLGMKEENIKTNSFGSEAPIYVCDKENSNCTDKEKAENRRVEFYYKENKAKR